MKKIFAMVAALALALAFAGCSSPGSLEVVSDDEGVHITATGAADAEVWGDIDLQAGQGICMNPAVTKGTISIRIADSTGATLYDDEVSGSSSILVPEATGSCDLIVTAKGAEGTVEVFAYDIAAAAESDAALPTAVK